MRKYVKIQIYNICFWIKSRNDSCKHFWYSLFSIFFDLFCFCEENDSIFIITFISQPDRSYSSIPSHCPWRGVIYNYDLCWKIYLVVAEPSLFLNYQNMRYVSYSDNSLFMLISYCCSNINVVAASNLFLHFWSSEA